jgi:hypothetical protein
MLLKMGFLIWSMLGRHIDIYITLTSNTDVFCRKLFYVQILSFLRQFLWCFLPLITKELMLSPTNVNRLYFVNIKLFNDHKHTKWNNTFFRPLSLKYLNLGIIPVLPYEIEETFRSGWRMVNWIDTEIHITFNQLVVLINASCHIVWYHNWEILRKDSH